MAFVLPSHCDVQWDPALLEVLNTSPAMGSRVLIPYFALLVYAAFASLIKLSLSQHTSFPAFTFLILRTMAVCFPLLTLWLTEIFCFPSVSLL